MNYLISTSMKVGGAILIGALGYEKIIKTPKEEKLLKIESEKGGFIYGSEKIFKYVRLLRLRTNKEGPVISILSPSRTGKTETLISNNVLDKQYNGSMIILDLKKNEAFNKFSKPLIEMGYNVVCVDIDNPDESQKMNPFEIYKYITNGVDKLIMILLTAASSTSKVSMDINSKDDTEWENLSRDYLKALVYHIVDENIGEPFKYLEYVTGLPQEEYDKIILNSKSENAKRTHQRFLNSLKTYETNKKVGSEGLFVSVKQTINSKLSIFYNENIYKLTEKTTFHPASVLTGTNNDGKGTKDKTVLFYCYDASSESFVYAGISILFTHMFYDAIEEAKKDEKLARKRVRFYMDEFLTLGKIWLFVNRINTCASQNIAFIIAIQNFEYFKELYGEGNAVTILENGTIIAMNDTNPEFVKKYVLQYCKLTEAEKEKAMLHVIEPGKCIIRSKLKLAKKVDLPPRIILDGITKPNKKELEINNYIDPGFEAVNNLKSEFENLLKENKEKTDEVIKYSNITQELEAVINTLQKSNEDINENLKNLQSCKDKSINYEEALLEAIKQLIRNNKTLKKVLKEKGIAADKLVKDIRIPEKEEFM